MLRCHGMTHALLFGSYPPGLRTQEWLALHLLGLDACGENNVSPFEYMLGGISR